MTLAANINRQQGQVIHGVHISGIGTLIVSRQPVSPDGTPWTDPTCAVHTSHSYGVEVALDDTAGLRAHPEAWDPRSGVSQGGGMTIRLRLTDAVLALFAAESPSINRTVLTSTVGYDVAGTGEDRYQLQVEDTSAFDSAGYVWAGQECIYYPSNTASAFGSETAPDRCERGVWTWTSDSRLSRRHVSTADEIALPAVVTDHPKVWCGRRVTVLQWLCDDEGRCLDSDYRGDHEVEVWSGWIDTVEYGSPDYTSLTLECRSLAQGVLEREIGRDKVRAYVGGAYDRTVECYPGIMVIPHMSVSWNSHGPTPIGPIRITADGVQSDPLLSGTYSLDAVARAIGASIGEAVTAQIAAWGGSDTVDGLDSTVYGEWDSLTNERAYRARLQWLMGTYTAAVDILATDLGTVGKLIGLPTIPWTRIAGTTQPTRVWGEAIPAYLQLTPVASSINCYPDPDEAETFPDGPGWAKVEWDGQTEVIYYATKSTLSATQGTFQLSGLKRGRMGTAPISAEWLAGQSGEGPTITAVYGWEDVALPDVLLQMMTSTGTGDPWTPTAGAYGEYDLVPAIAGVALDPAAVDVGSFQAMASEPYIRRTLCPEKPLKCKEFIGKNGVFHGYVFGGRVGRDGRFRLGLQPVPYPTNVRSGLTLSEAADGGILRTDPTLRTTYDVITRVEVAAAYNPITGDNRGDPVTVIYANGVDTYPDGETLEVDVPGLANADLYTAAEYTSERLFSLWGEPQYLVRVYTDRRALLVAPGETVQLTVEGIPTPYGTRGLTAQSGVVVSTSKGWFSSGESQAVELDVLLADSYGGIAPTFSVSVSGTTCTVADNVFSRVGDVPPWDGYAECKDWMFGPASGETYAMTFWAEGAYDAAETRTVQYTSDGTWTLSSALTITPDYAEFAVWGTAGRDADQDLYVHIADSAETLGAGGDPGFEWSP